MAFKFSLATVLRLRQVAEEREERLLQQIQQEIATTLQSIARADQEIAQCGLSRHAQLNHPLAAVVVRSSYDEVAFLRQSRAVLCEQLAKFESLREAQFRVYLSAQQNREMLSGMHSNQRKLHESKVSKYEQRTLDDNYAARRIHLGPKN